jgi:hypothetical protein
MHSGARQTGCDKPLAASLQVIENKRIKKFDFLQTVILIVFGQIFSPGGIRLSTKLSTSLRGPGGAREGSA